LRQRNRDRYEAAASLPVLPNGAHDRVEALSCCAAPRGSDPRKRAAQPQQHKEELMNNSQNDATAISEFDRLVGALEGFLMW
jgi:hypothetical protein